MLLQAELTALISDRQPAKRISEVLGEILEAAESEDLQAIWHPLGFIDIPIAQSTSARLRESEHYTVHVWHPRLSVPQVPRHVCHSHEWSLRSCVLYGEITNESYTVIPSEDGDHMLYEVHYGDGISYSGATGQSVDVEQSDRTAIPQWGWYEIESPAFHWSRVGDSDLVITAMQSSSHTGCPPRNVRRKPCAENYVYHRHQCPSEARSMIFTDMLSRLTS
jgi:hypothetical protein